MEGNIRGYYRLIREEFFKMLRSQFSSANHNLTDQQVSDIFAAKVSEHHAELSSKEFADSIPKKFEEDFRVRHLDRFKKIRDNVFEKLPISNNIAKLLNDIAVFIHSRKVYSQNLSGVVVAGYGEKEIYPSVISYDVEGVIDDTIKYAINEKKSGSITGGSECQIIPFAQDDMVATFMNGINPELLNFLSSYLTETFRRLPDIFLAKSATKKLKNSVTKDAAQLLSNLFDDLKNHLHDVHISPVLNMVTVLPKDELAEMAESLVNLTAFKRRMTDSVETVGGPIDVAVISKGDGLVWIKRKHYFPQELNQHFFRNYFRGIGDGKTT